MDIKFLNSFCQRLQFFQTITNILERFLDSSWRNTMFVVVCKLRLATPVGLINCRFHGVCHFIRIHEHSSIYMASSPTGRLNQRSSRTQESLFISVQNSNQTDLRKIKSFSEQVNTNHHIVNSES